MSPAHQEELELLLKPIGKDAPCGPPLRHDPIFTEIRLAREEDDPSLPMGGWERPLKRADWALIESRCKLTLCSRSKDLQIAAWLLEAWTRQYGLEGLHRGLALLERLVQQYWTTLHPLIDDDGDADARVAPFEWLNASFSVTVRLHMALLNMAGRKAPGPALADWERMIAAELAGAVQGQDKAAGDGADAPLMRIDVVNYAHRRPAREMAGRMALIKRSLQSLEATLAFVDLQLGAQAPNLSKLKAVLVAIERVLAQLIPEPKEEDMMPEIAHVEEEEEAGAGPVAAAPAPAVLSGWKDRNEAYATLSALADYLSMVEPHSPTPYLLRRAVNWGRMPLPELMAEIIREEGDLNRLVNMLGLTE